MDLDWIRHLPIKDLVAEDAGLALWVYGPMLPEAFDVMDSCGFHYKSDLFTWEKVTGAGDPAFGTGYYTRKSTEQLLYATRGRGLRRIDRSVPQCVRAPRREHSCKPDEVIEGLERLFGPVRRLELFARRQRPGWEAWGNEIIPVTMAVSFVLAVVRSYRRLDFLRLRARRVAACLPVLPHRRLVRWWKPALAM
jgi:N6-adenosine-specific RNA methylase IME4